MHTLHTPFRSPCHRERRSNVNHMPGRRGVVMGSVGSGSAILGDAACRLGTPGKGGGARHTWLAVSGTSKNSDAVPLRC